MKLEVFGTMEVPCKHLKSAPVLAVSPRFRIVAEYFFSWPMLLCNGCAEHRRGLGVELSNIFRRLSPFTLIT